MKVKIGKYPKNDKERKVEVIIDDYDTWSLDHTLALIILPALKRLKKVSICTPLTDFNDAPIKYRGVYNPDNYCDSKIQERWDYVLDEMIWAFEQIAKDDYPGICTTKDQRRINNGLRLFGKYYQALWW